MYGAFPVANMCTKASSQTDHCSMPRKQYQMLWKSRGLLGPSFFPLNLRVPQPSE